MKPIDKATLDQAVAAIVDHNPALWSGLYLDLKARGVSEEATIRFVCEFIKATCTLSGKDD